MEFERFDLADGVRLFVGATPKFKTLSLRGYAHRPLARDATAIALLPQVLRRGFGPWKTQQALAVHLEGLYGASFGADVMKFGEQHVVTWALETVNDRFAPSKVGVLEQAVELMAAAVAKPVLSKGAFRGDVVAQEKENLKRRIEGLVNDLGAWAFERCLAAMCAEEPYAINEYGRVDDLPDLTPEELTRKHRDTLARWPIDFVALGDLEPEAVAKAFRRRLPLDRDGVKAPPAAVIRPAPARPREIVEKMAVEQGKLVIGCRTSTTWADDDIVALTFANGLLGAYPHSKLFANVRERDGLAYSVHSSVDPTKGLLFITAGIDPARYGRVVEVIRSQMKAVHDGDLTDEEIAKTRASLVSRARSRADSPSAMIDAFHEMAWLGRVIPEEELVRRTQAVRTEDVMRVMEKVSIDTIYLLAP